ncbi:DUF1214 domain-containing protein, partial [Brucella sp. 22210]|uniref:DUF1214 domain-containing protein n=1 Tax=Brucella sp. 22210 TaxID=3453892 RepID=UPI003F850880
STCRYSLDISLYPSLCLSLSAYADCPVEMGGSSPSFTPAKNDGKTVYILDVPKNVPVKAFWSISVYNPKGYFEKNDYDAYSLNSITSKKNADGSVTAQFGGCDGKIPNCLPIVDGWNYTVRLYRPDPSVVSGEWKFPEAKPQPN